MPVFFVTQKQDSYFISGSKKKQKLQETDQDESQIEEVLTNGNDPIGNGTDAIEHIENPNESMNNSHDTGNHLMVFKTDPLDESQIEEINLEDQIGRVQKRNHLCQVCGNSFASESQLFNHFDASSSKRIR